MGGGTAAGAAAAGGHRGKPRPAATRQDVAGSWGWVKGAGNTIGA
jgi:hypothetical protein